MSILNTQDVTEDYKLFEEVQGGGDEVWGRLYPLHSSFKPIDLTGSEYLFGRDDCCDYRFTCDTNGFQALSKKHFVISKESVSTGVFVFVQDKSSNGTFINRSKIGRNNKQILRNMDEIQLALPSNKAFVFMDTSREEDLGLPTELLEKYTVSRLLGRGACGEVRLAFEKSTCKRWALKIVSYKEGGLSFPKISQKSNSSLSEANILRSLNHPCIISVEGVYRTKDKLCMVLELVDGGELFERIVESDGFDEATAKILFYQMCLAVKYLHDNGITHRDLKPENILLSSATDNKCLVKVTDFGLSKFVDSQTMLTTFCGTPVYLAPEVILSAGYGSYSNKIDCWSLGVILFVCLVAYPPFSLDHAMDLSEQITGGHYNLSDEYWKGFSESVKDLVRKLLEVNPEKRSNMTDALEHKWFRDSDMRAHVDDLFRNQASPTHEQTDASPIKCGKREEKGDIGYEPVSKKKM